MKTYEAHYYGIVKSVDDPEDLGRILVTVPEVFGLNPNPIAALPRGSFSGPGYGAQFIPRVGEWVIISFRNGSYETPYWEHAHWARGEKPEDFKDPSTMGWITPNGTKVIIQDGEEKVNITLPSGTELELKEDQVTLKSGKVFIHTEDQGSIEVGPDRIKVFGETTVKGEALQDILKDLVTTISSLKIIVVSGAMVLDVGTIADLTALSLRLSTQMLAETS